MSIARSTRTRVLAVLATFAAVMIACGLDAVGTGPSGAGVTTTGEPDATGTPDGGGSAEAAADGSTVTLGQDASVADAPLDAPLDVVVIKDAAPDGAIVFTCPTGDTTDCSTCGGGRTLGCVMCATAGPGIYAVCTPPGVSCYANYRPANYTWCRCPAADPSVCILPKQGCNPYDNGVCVTCGENATNGDPCKGGGTCNESQAKCL